MHTFCRAAIGALCSPFLALATGQAPLPIDSQLLLPAAPAIGALRFDLDGTFSTWLPEPIDAYADLSPLHQRMLRTLTDRRFDDPVVHGCWLDPVSPMVAALFNAAIHGPAGFQLSNRWNATATQGGGLGMGDPTILTVSFVPDGTPVPNGVGEGAGTSNLIGSFNAVFPSQAIWQNRIMSAFTNWGTLIGVTYVFEPNDDGAPMFGSQGVLGVRGDVRISGKFIDGGGGILAYDFYPDGSDMVIDTGDSTWFANSSNNYRRLFNVCSHEHGHGLGLDHVCPTDQTKLMEPYISTAYEGPQYDDIMGAQRFYGDRFEHNDSAPTATDLGSVPNGHTLVSNVSIDRQADLDYFRFTLTSDKLVTVTMHPTGSPYVQGPQVGNCTTGATFNPVNQRNLGLVMFDGAATQVLAFATSQPAGIDEVITSLPLTAGSYLVRVAGDSVDAIQMYQLDVGIVDNGPVATTTSIGSSCGGLTWNPLNRPILGTNQFVILGGIQNPPSSIALVLLGYNQLPGGVDLTFLGAPGCFAYVDIVDVQSAFPLVSTSYLWHLAIPATASLVGAVIDTQGALLVPPGSNPLGLLTSNAVELLIGTQ